MEYIERNLGEQPIKKILDEHQLNAHDLVAASTEQITHKMVQRAIKGRRLSTHVKQKICNALNNASSNVYNVTTLFNY